MHRFEKDLLIALYQYPDTVKDAGANLDASAIAGYAFNLAKIFNKFYGEVSILKAENETAKLFRIQLAEAVADVLKKAFALLGIEMPERM